MSGNARKRRGRALTALFSAGFALSCVCAPLTALAAETDAAEVICDGTATRYSSCDAAWNAASAGGKSATVKLLTNWNVSHAYTVAKGRNVTLDLNGYTVDRRLRGKMSDNGNVFRVSGTFTIIDSAPDSTSYSEQLRGGVITGGAGDDCGGGIIVDEGAAFNMNGGSIVGCVSNYDGGALYIDEDARVNIENAGFYSNMVYDSMDSCYGGAIYADEGSSVVIKNSIFENNYSEDSGGAVYLDCGSLSACGCLFRGNKCLDDGGAVYSAADGVFTSGGGNGYEPGLCLEDCTLSGNIANGNGGAVYGNSSNTTRLMYSTLEGNYSAKNGGAVYVNADNLCVMDTSVVSNNCGGLGGGVYVDSMYDLNVQGKTVVQNNTHGGKTVDNVYLQDGMVTAAHIFNGGLTDNAVIGVSTEKDISSYTVVKLTSEYQTRFFVSDNTGSRIQFKEDKEKEQREYLIASSLGTGSLAQAGVILAALAAAAAVVAVVKRAVKGRREERSHES